jgi:glutaredoxin-like protein
MNMPVIRIYGTTWCGDCIRTRSYLLRHQIAFEWIDIDRDKEGEKYVIQINKGMRSVPTILFPDGSILVEPTNSEIEVKLTKFRKESGNGR